MKALLRNVLDKQHLAIISDDLPLHPRNKANFVAITIRNVCDLYLSFTSFGAWPAMYGR
jgi:hypothetical protein